MQCKSCGFENPEGFNFCGKCSAQLLDTGCQKCGFINPPGFEYCGKCGAPLKLDAKTSLDGNAEIPPYPESQESPQFAVTDSKSQSPDAERRQITVMFCDLVESTALFEKLDPEDIRLIIREYQTVSAKLIKKYDGHIAKYLGDGILIYFGYPRAHEDDAERAVHTGLEIVEEIKGLGEGVEQSKDIRLQVRIGISTGLVVAGEMGGGENREPMAIVGDSPNIAARLQSLAEPNNVLISSSTHKLVEGYFEFIDLGEKSLKGLSIPVRVYRVVRGTDIRSHIDAAINKGLTPLVGRDHELGLLLERWERVKRGEGQVVLLRGEAGIGKSRLVQMLKEHLTDEPHLRIESRCSPFYLNSALYPVIDNLQNLLRKKSEESAQEKITILESILEKHGFSLDEVIPLIAPLLSIPIPDNYEPLTLTPQMKKQKTLTTLASWLLKETEAGPVVRIIEDLHWVDPTTLEFLSLLIEQVPTAPILIIFTYRPDFTLEWAHRSHITQIALNRLTDNQVTVMAESMTGGKSLPAEVLHHLVSKTDGVPLFVEELTKMILESDILEESGGRFMLKDALPEHVIPTTLQDSLMARLDRLDTIKEVVQLGAALGREFNYELLNRVWPFDEAILKDELTKLVEAELLYQRGFPPNSRYIFKHALIQDAAYQSILKSKRLVYHKKIAQILEEGIIDDSQTPPELLAHHYTKAGLVEKAIPYLRTAGQKAVELSTMTEAVIHLNKGLELLRALPETTERKRLEVDFQSNLGTAYVAAKGWAAPEVGIAYSRSRVLSEELGDTKRLYPILWGLCSFHLVRAEYEPTYELGKLILRFAKRNKDSEIALPGHHALGMAQYCRGDFVDARKYLDESVALYNRGKHDSDIMLYGTDLGVFSICWSALALWQLGYTDQAAERSKSAIELAHELSHPLTLAIAYSYTAMFHQFRRDTDSARQKAEEAISISRDHGFPYYIAWGTLIDGWAKALEGDPGEQIPYMSKGLTDLQSTGAERSQSYYLALLAEVYARSDRADEALNLLRQAISFVDQKNERWWESELYRLKGDILLNLNENEPEVEKSYQKAVQVALRQNAKSLELRAQMSLSRLLLSQGKNSEAKNILSETVEWFTEGHDNKELTEAKNLVLEL